MHCSSTNLRPSAARDAEVGQTGHGAWRDRAKIWRSVICPSPRHPPRSPCQVVSRQPRLDHAIGGSQRLSLSVGCYVPLVSYHRTLAWRTKPPAFHGAQKRRRAHGNHALGIFLPRHVNNSRSPPIFVPVRQFPSTDQYQPTVNVSVSLTINIQMNPESAEEARNTKLGAASAGSS